MALVAIWTRQYITEDDLAKRVTAKPYGAVMMTEARMTNMVNEAYEAGRAKGDLEGRYSLRQMIERGEVEGISTDA